MADREISFEIVESIGVIGAGFKEWKKELNLVAWNGRDPKLDLREWSEDHQNMGKGITLTREEGARLATLLEGYLKKA